MTLAVLTPFDHGNFVELAGGRWRKQILPLGSISYKGKQITFDRDYLSGLVRSFRDKAFGAVPFQLADAKNTHTNDPERRRGTVVDLEITADGLDAIVELDDRGRELIAEYPDLGVSARIYESYDRSDGSFFPNALQHVLGTLDPHVTGLRPWQAVAMSNEVSGPVIDLSGTEFETGREVEPVADRNSLKAVLKKLREGGDETELSDEELDQLLAIAEAMGPAGGDTDPPKPKEDELTDEELDRLIKAAEEEANQPEAPEEEKEPAVVAATNESSAALELANAQIEQQRIELANVKARLDAGAFEVEQRTFAEKFGIPPNITEMARPLLEGDSRVVQLANGEEADASAIMRNVLTTIGSSIKLLDLGGLIGNGEDEPTDSEREANQAKAEETRQFVADMRKQYSF